MKTKPLLWDLNCRECGEFYLHRGARPPQRCPVCRENARALKSKPRKTRRAA